MEKCKSIEWVKLKRHRELRGSEKEAERKEREKKKHDVMMRER